MAAQPLSGETDGVRDLEPGPLLRVCITKSKQLIQDDAKLISSDFISHSGHSKACRHPNPPYIGYSNINRAFRPGK